MARTGSARCEIPLPRSIPNCRQYQHQGLLYAHICVLHNEHVVHGDDVDVLHAALLELLIRLDVTWDLAATGAGERTGDSDLDRAGACR